ncbi:cytotoxic T-lymphocyte protein 4 isoform X2 [Parambassis ranga]|uniref:Cytotoxic T-lymphocyte protein 4 isoform X2 n=1 Tax=Parambassis ranga TaxID=210632 RepID=A0A6P7HH27_9TELE|nr:cytotoxic T-lymphocyte protein 4-like isoform X2 [Parambassis ranga]
MNDYKAVKVMQPYSVVSTNGIAQIQCLTQPSHHRTQRKLDNQIPQYPYPDPEELRVTLLKGLHGNHEVCSSFLNLTEPSAMHAVRKGEMQCSATAKDGAVEVTVSGLKPTDTDIYRCQIHILYPPPYLQHNGNGTLIHVLDGADCSVPSAQRQNLHQGAEGEEDEPSEPVSVAVVGLVVAITCVLAIIIYFQTLQCLGRRREIFRAVPSVQHKVDPASFPHEIIV